MEVSFANSKLQKVCNSAKKLRGEYGPRMADIIQQRLAELADAETLADMTTIPGAKCHELTQNLKGLLAVSLIYPDRMAFKPNESPLPKKQDGGLDWSRVKHIEVTGIGDYH
jgi:toxin HigB-1